MNHVMLICSDGIPTEDKAATMGAQLDPYVEAVKASGSYVYGHRLAHADTAKTVRVRDGQALVSDGPFAESKEFVAGFDVFDAEATEQMTELASRHPVSWFHCVEVRRLGEPGPGRSLEAPASQLFSGPPEGTSRFAIFICIDGIPLGDEEEDALSAAMDAWGDRLRADGIAPLGFPLQPAWEAKTVRVRGGETAITDGPFVEAKEFLAGLVIVDVPSLDDAVTIAAQSPIASYHRLEVRPFHTD